MPKPSVLKCVLCGKEFEPDRAPYTCDVCGLDGTLDVLYDYQSIKHSVSCSALNQNRERSMWRYRAVLPVVEEASIPDLNVGWTPFYRSGRLARTYGVKEVYVKDDGRNPTGSLKDRASAVGVAKALDLKAQGTGRPVVACASTGNAASSLAGFAAVAGLKSFIFVPEQAPAAKVTQLLVYGATVVLVKGDYADAFDLATAAIDKYGWYNRNCAINPYLVEGKKTCAMEIAEQSDWDVPDRVFISVGDGCCIGGLYKGFRDLKELGLIDRLPKIIGVQAEGAKPIYDAWRLKIEAQGAELVRPCGAHCAPRDPQAQRAESVRPNRKVVFSKAETLADSISVGSPRNWAKALRAVCDTSGDMVAVTDEEILSAIPELARGTGVFGEPAGAAAFAGFRKAASSGLLGKDERIAVVITGNGLKDIANAQKSVGKAVAVKPDLADLERHIEI
ncbi:MAG: pyridoxal-phosphate dependent enzyme [Synergistaceae bacterium]|nr:pyridoxal-phosphate dependent enzyme [Synergistaceae bacterium]